jgi:iron complex transport system ATP-binding protein
MLKLAMTAPTTTTENSEPQQPPIELAAVGIDVWYDPQSNGDPQLKGVGIRIEPGQLTAVIGPNGSGKTALVRTLSRTLAPKSGAVILNGLNLYTQMSAKESALKISVVPQIN